MEAFPRIPKELLDALESMFPGLPPRLDDTERMVWFKAGQHSVVEFVKEQHQRQNETII